MLLSIWTSSSESPAAFRSAFMTITFPPGRWARRRRAGGNIGCRRIAVGILGGGWGRADRQRRARNGALSSRPAPHRGRPPHHVVAGDLCAFDDPGERRDPDLGRRL